MLKKTIDFNDFNDLLLAAYSNLAQAVDFAREAQRVEQSLEDRTRNIELAKGELGCLCAHFIGGLQLIPLEEDVQT